jgi:hypothetical protein
MIQEADPDDADWWDVVYLYLNCLRPHLPESYYQVLEHIRSSTSNSGPTIVGRFYATVTLGSVAQQQDDWTRAIQLYDEAEQFYSTLTLEERQQLVRAIPTHDPSLVAFLTSTELESVETILDRAMVPVRQSKLLCQELLQQRQQEEQQAQQDEQHYHDLAQSDNDDEVPNDLLHLWQFPHRAVSPHDTPSKEPQQVRSLPTHPKVKWLLRMVVDDDGVTYGQVYRVPHLQLVHEIVSSCALHTYATACRARRYQPYRLYVSQPLDPALLCQLARMGCTHVTQHR